MKQLYGKLWVKCTAIALLVVFAILFAASALGTAYLFTYGAYADGGEQVRQIAENEILQQTNGDGWTALHAWVDDDKITRDLLRERYDPLTSNIYFKLTDKDTGKILFSTGALNKDDYTGKASAYYQQDMTTSLDDGSDVTAVYQAYLKSPLAPRDSALYIMTWVERLISARYLLIVLAVLLLAVCLFLFIFLLCAMGHKEGVDGIYQCWLNRIPVLHSSHPRNSRSGADAHPERCGPCEGAGLLQKHDRLHGLRVDLPGARAHPDGLADNADLGRLLLHRSASDV